MKLVLSVYTFYPTSIFNFKNLLSLCFHRNNLLHRKNYKAVFSFVQETCVDFPQSTDQHFQSPTHTHSIFSSKQNSNNSPEAIRSESLC